MPDHRPSTDAADPADAPAPGWPATAGPRPGGGPAAPRPEADVARALDRLSAGELGRLARLLAQATDLHQIARRILAELRQQLDANVGSSRRPL